MKKYLIPAGVIIFFLIAGFYLFNSKQISKTATPQVSPPTNQQAKLAINGVFEGITPCSNVERPLPQIPANASCEMTIWHISFNPNSTYTLTSSYGMTQPNTPGIRGGGTKITMEGNWTVIRGTKTDPQATVIQLNSENPQISVSFLVVSDGIIHLLDNNKNMMVGNGGWAYTLSKTSGQSSGEITLPQAPNEPPTIGVFEGRTLCLDFLAEFAEKSANSPLDCNRIKWRLTLYQDSETGNPTRYVFGVRGRADSHEGNWSILRGTKSDPNALVYQFRPDSSNQSISLLKVDDNHLFFLDEDMNLLVGNSLWSYTLSRTLEGE